MSTRPVLYHCNDARSFRALWALEELGMAYDLKLLPFPPRMLSPEYLKENPLGTIPLLVDGDVRMTESAAIVQYLATRSGPSVLSVEPGDGAYGAWLNGLHFGEATLTFPQTLVLRYTRLEPKERRNPQVAETIRNGSLPDFGDWMRGWRRAVASIAPADSRVPTSPLPMPCCWQSP